MMDYKRIATELVSTGANVLDAVKPDWLDSMPDDVRQINFMDPDRCPLHYVFGDYLEGSGIIADAGFRFQNLYGFASPSAFVGLDTIDRLVAYDEVNQAWRKLVTARRGL